MPSSVSTRVRISPAALLVNVTARIAVGLGEPLADEVRDAVRDDAGLAGARARENQQRAFGLEDGFLLFGIEAGEQVQASILPSSDGRPRESALLLYRDALREVARLVDVAAAPDRDVIRQQLQRDRHDDRRQQWRSCAASAATTSFFGSSTAAIRVSPSRRDRDHGAAARLRLLDVADHLLEHVVVGRDRDDRHPLVDERDRPVLHLAGRIALGVDVGDLLELERAFERDRIVDAAAEEQEVGAVVEPLRDLARSRADALIACSMICGSCSSSSMWRRISVGDSVPRTCAMYSASSCSATSCEVNALVDATPISGPACV